MLGLLSLAQVPILFVVTAAVIAAVSFAASFLQSKPGALNGPAILACTLLLVACGRAPGIVEPRSPVTVTATGYEFLGSKFDDFDKLKDAVDGNPLLKLSLMINEERGCVSSERVSQVVGLLKSRDESSVAFIGQSSTDVCQR